MFFENLLREAAATGKLESLKQLHLEGNPLQSADPNTKKTALHRASECGQLSTLDYLLKHRVEIDSQDADGNTALNLVLQSKLSLTEKIEVTRQLIQAGTDPNLANASGTTPLQILMKLRDKTKLTGDQALSHAMATLQQAILLFEEDHAEQTKAP